MQGLALEVGREEVLADLALGQLVDDDEGLRVLRRARLVDLPDDLDRLLDLLASGTCRKTPPVQKAAVAAGNLPSSGDAGLPVLLDQLRVLLGRFLERRQRDALVIDLAVDDRCAALHDQRRELVVRDDLGTLA